MFRYPDSNETKTEVYGRIDRIMVVDDEKDILRIVKQDLELDGGYFNNGSDCDIKFTVDTFSDTESVLIVFQWLL